jgi:general secretion pathway protein D
MKQRNEKNVLTTVIFFTLLLSSQSVLKAQDGFDRFDAPSEFSGDGMDGGFDNSPPIIMDGGEDIQEGEYFEDTAENSNSGGAPSSGSGPSKVTSDQKFFGRGKQTKPTKDQKYVSLNPETGFGPDVVESFDFPDTDILELTKHMQKLTGINLILDKDVKGKVSISAPTPITVGDAWKAYTSALFMAGYTMVKSGSFYKIIPLRQIKFTPTKIYTGDYTPDTENFITKVIPLKYANASEIERKYRQFNTQNGRIIALDQTNTILIQDTGTNIKRLEMLVKSVDAPGFEESLQIIKVKNTSAQEIAKLLDNILQDNKNNSRNSSASRFRASTGPGPGPSISRIIAETRTNSIIAMANKAGTKHLEELINKLDVSNVSRGSNRIQVYYLQYGDSENLSKTLTALISNAQAQAQASRSNDNGNNGGFSPPSNRFAGRNGQQGGQTEAIFAEEVKITADKATNAIVVTASPTDWLTVKEVIKKLDIPRDQVFVEGLILETTEGQDFDYSINVAGASGTAAMQKTGVNYDPQNRTGPGFLELLNNSAFSLGGFFTGIGIGKRVELQAPDGKKYSVNSVNALIKAFATASHANIVATPQVLVMDNSEGTFKAGEQVPYAGDSTISSGVAQTSTKFQDISLELTIKPQINKETRFIKLNLEQKLEDASKRQVSSQTGGVATFKRQMKTEIVVKDQDTIAMGGLMRDKEEETERKIPLLGDIPVLGWLFKSTSTSKLKSNVIFFLTPRIISPYEKYAAANTKRVMDERKKHLGPTDEKTKDFSSKIQDVKERIEQQASTLEPGKTGDLSRMDNPGQVNKEQLEEVDYQSISEEIQKQ